MLPIQVRDIAPAVAPASVGGLGLSATADLSKEWGHRGRTMGVPCFRMCWALDSLTATLVIHCLLEVAETQAFHFTGNFNTIKSGFIPIQTKPIFSKFPHEPQIP